MTGRSRSGVVLIATVIAVVLFAPQVRAQELVPLIEVKDPSHDWTFNNGREFPGETGLAADRVAAGIILCATW